ncbi:MAG: hemagglutinin protein [Bacteroidota bacterium]
MSVPVFNQVSGLLYELSTNSEASAAGFWAGYYASTGSSLGSSASTTAVWQDIGGFYLFLKEQPADWSVFIDGLTRLRPNLAPPNALRILWIYNSDESYLRWNFTKVETTTQGRGSSIAWTIQRAFSFGVGAYQITIPGQSEFTFVRDEDGGGFSFSGVGYFTAAEGGYDFSPGTVAFSGSNLGVLNGEMTIPTPATGARDFWSAFRIGLQYAVEPADPSGGSSNGATQVLLMPIFSGQSAAMTLGVTFDPLNPLLADRTAISLRSPTQASPGPLNSYLRTTLGYPITLEPQVGRGATPSARFVFGQCPVSVDPLSELLYHLSPDGAFNLSVVPPGATDPAISYQLLLGLSGIEYINLSGSDQVVFRSGQAAYIPAVQSSLSNTPDVSQALTTQATTSHLTIMPQGAQATGLVYYAQPKHAPIFSGQSNRSDDVLDFNPMPALTLGTASQALPEVFPAGIYAGLETEAVQLAEQVEHASIAPYRHHKIGENYGQAIPVVPERRTRATDDPLGVTPQGLVAELTPDYQDFDGLYLGNMPNTNYPRVDLTVVTGMFKQSLQSNQLFFVAANVEVLMSNTSVRYQLQENDQPYLEAREVPAETITAVYNAISGQAQPFETESAFVNVIQSAAGDYLSDFLEVAGILKVEIDGWTFQLSPRSWRTAADSPTLMIAKFCRRSLLEMAQDSSSWAWPAVATPSRGTLADTQGTLLSILNAAGAADATEDYKIFYDTIVTDPNWNGFLFLNAPVDISELPDDLEFLVAGIDLTKFYAHHLGFSQTPFQVINGMPTLDQTAAFGLIDYTDTLDLYADESIPLGFKTMQLKARFANAALVDFSTQVELMLNQLLAAQLTKQIAARGNNLIIDGSYQRVGGAPSYAFALVGENLFNASRSALSSIEVLSVHLVTGGSSDSDEVLTMFKLMGNMRFILLPDFDLFSFGPSDVDGQAEATDSFLRYSGLTIDMRFSLATPDQQTFTVHEDSVSFDASNSVLRQSGLLNNFPLTVNSLIASPNLSPDAETPTGQTPEDMGYTSVSAPLEQTPMVPTWFGLQFILDMGTLGALTGSQSLKIAVLAAWSEGADQNDIPVYIGLKLPNIAAIGGSLPLQGVLKLGFRSFQFQTYTTTDPTTNTEQLAYLLRMRRFALSFLVFSFPPGNADIVLFGQPDNPKGSLGWYAAYDQGESSSADSSMVTSANAPMLRSAGPPAPKMDRMERKLKSGRRTPPIG